MGKQTQVFENRTSDAMGVDVEYNPDGYILKPGDIMHITYEHGDDGGGLHTVIGKGGLTIYLQHFDTAVVTINGERIEPWSQYSKAE